MSIKDCCGSFPLFLLRRQGKRVWGRVPQEAEAFRANIYRHGLHTIWLGLTRRELIAPCTYRKTAEMNYYRSGELSKGRVKRYRTVDSCQPGCGEGSGEDGWAQGWFGWDGVTPGGLFEPREVIGEKLG